MLDDKYSQVLSTFISTYKYLLHFLLIYFFFCIPEYYVLIPGASRETDISEMDVTGQVEGVEAWVGGN